MGYWGWRRLLTAFISVWVVGCSVTQDSAPTTPPTIPPPVTLIVRLPISPTPLDVVPIPTTPAPPATAQSVVYTIQSGDTLLGIALQFGVTADTIRAANPNLTSDTLQIGQQIVIPAPLFDTSGNPLLPTSTPLSLPLPSPVCTITPTEHILCLGTVHNALDFPVERVAVQVRLLRADGSLLIEGSAGLEQVLIPAGQSAPYSLLLQANWRDYAGAVAALTSAESAARDQRFIPIEVEDNQGHNESGAYSITARFHNTSEQIAHIGRIIAALYDADGRVISYRVIALKQDLLPDAVYAFNFTLIPPPNTTPATHTLYVEALRANTKP